MFRYWYNGEFLVFYINMFVLVLLSFYGLEIVCYKIKNSVNKEESDN